MRQRDFRLVWCGQTVSLLGDSFHVVALAWLVLQLSGSPLALGGVLTARAMASTALLLLGGVVVDRLTPHTLMVASAAARCVIVVVLTVVVAAGSATVAMVVALEVAFGCADAFALPAAGSIAPTLLPSHHLEAASALGSISDNISRLAGPLLAGALVAAFGVAPAFAVDAASFAVAAALVAAVRPGQPGSPAPAQKGRHVVADVREGIGHVLTVPALRAVLVLFAAGALCLGGPYLVGLPALTVGRFGGGALLLGALYSAWGLGQLAGNLQGGMSAPPIRPATRVAGLTALTAIGWALVAVAPAPLVAIALIAAAGAADGVAEVIVPAWVQRQAQPRLLGRVMSGLEVANNLALAVSLLVSGAVAAVAPGAVFAAGGVGLGLAALVPLLTVPREGRP
ncbi:MAG TPA: MFS transporter [Candidatus Dormibacteraeota bacterium]